MRFLLQMIIEFPEPPVDFSAKLESELKRQCSWLGDRCDQCGEKPRITIHEVTTISPRRFAVFWSEAYCCELAAQSAALEFDQDMLAGILDDLHPESDWRPWLDSRSRGNSLHVNAAPSTRKSPALSTALESITPQEYLNRERQTSTKSEFVQGEIFAMGGGSANHCLIASNFVCEAVNALKDRPCAVFNSDLRVQVRATGLYTYPDATIVCGEQEFDDGHRDTLINPTVIVEVLSESTEKYDRGKKSNHYRQILSLQELVLVAQDRPCVEQYTRRPNGDWLFHEQSDLSGSFELTSVRISMDLAELYRGVKFPPIEDEPQTGLLAP